MRVRIQHDGIRTLVTSSNLNASRRRRRWAGSASTGPHSQRTFCETSVVPSMMSSLTISPLLFDSTAYRLPSWLWSHWRSQAYTGSTTRSGQQSRLNRICGTRNCNHSISGTYRNTFAPNKHTAVLVALVKCSIHTYIPQ